MEHQLAHLAAWVQTAVIHSGRSTTPSQASEISPGSSKYCQGKSLMLVKVFERLKNKKNPKMAVSRWLWSLGSVHPQPGSWGQPQIQWAQSGNKRLRGSRCRRCYQNIGRRDWSWRALIYTGLMSAWVRSHKLYNQTGLYLVYSSLVGLRVFEERLEIMRKYVISLLVTGCMFLVTGVIAVLQSVTVISNVCVQKTNTVACIICIMIQIHALSMLACIWKHVDDGVTWWGVSGVDVCRLLAGLEGQATDQQDVRGMSPAY